MENKQIIRIVAIVILLLFILVVLALIARKRTEAQDRQQKTTQAIGSLPPASSGAAEPVKTNTGKKEKRKKVHAPAPERKLLSAPVLRCYDYFEFPKEGGFHVKTCGIPSSPSPTKLFIQWFPVDGASNYNIYLNKGSNVAPDNFQDKWTVGASNHYFESDTLTADGCWSMMVTAVDGLNTESPGSQVYTTCSK